MTGEHVKALITGASGFVGSTLVENLRDSELEVYPVFRQHLISEENAQYCDLRDLLSTSRMLAKIDPNVVVHCAATSSIEECERSKLQSWENNVISTMNILKSMKKYVHFIYLSTGEVFDGNIGTYHEDSVRNPLHWYGRTKLFCEDIVSNIAQVCTIVRLSYQYGFDLRDKNFLHQVLRKLTLGQSVSASDDLISSPTYIGTTVSAIKEIITDRLIGIYNIADKTRMSKYQLIYNLAQNLDKSSLVSREKSETVFLAKRPKNTSLNVNKFSSTFHISRPLDKKEALSKFYTDYNRGNSYS